MALRAVLMKTSLRPRNTARPVNTAHPITTVYSARPMPRVVNTAKPNLAVVNAVRVNQINVVKASACWVWRSTKLNSASITLKKHNYGHPQKEDQGYVDSGCPRHMTGNMSYLSDFKEFDRGYVTFGGGAKRGTGKGTLKTGKLDFKDVYFVKELQFNLFSVSQMCDKKNSVLFTNTGCFVLSLDFKLADESQVLLKVPRKNNMYIVDMKNIVPKESLTCLVIKATLDELMLWHRRLGHVKFKPINKLVKENIMRGLPTKRFENDQTCVTSLKRKRHKASCKSKVQNSITQPLFMLHMDLFSLTSVQKKVLVRVMLASDAEKKDDDGVTKESGINDQERPKNITTALLEATYADLFGDETKVDMSNITTTYLVPSTLNTRIHKDHSLDHVIGEVQSSVQTRRMTKTTNKQGFISAIYEGKTHEDLHTCLFVCFLSQGEPNKVCILVDLPYGKRAIETKWIYRNKKDERVARIKAIRLFLAYASFKDFVVYQMDVKNSFLYGKIEKEVYVCQPPGFEDLEFPDKVYKTASTPMETLKPLLKDENAKDDSPFDLEAYTDSDYAGASLDKKFTTEEKLEGSEGFYQIVDFLNATHIRIPIRKETEVPQPSSPPHANIADEAAFACVDKVDSLEKDLKQTNQIYGVAYTKLIKKVKKLEKTVKSSQARRRERIVVSDDEDDLKDSSKQERKIAAIDQDPAISLVQHDAEIQGRNGHDMEVDTVEPVYTASAAVTTVSITVSTASPTRVSTVDDITMAETLVYIRKSATKDKEAAMRLQAEIDEEDKQRISKVHETASSFNIEEWEDIRVRAEADEEPEAKRNKPITQDQQRTYMSNYIKHMTNYKLQQLKKLSFDEIKDLFEITIRRVNTFVPMETEVRRAVPELVADSSQAAVRKAGVLEEMMNIEALQTKYPIIDWEVYTKDSRNIVRWKMNFFKGYSCRQKDQEDEVFGSILLEQKVEMHRGIAQDKVENPDPQSAPQVLPSFEEYILPVTYPEEVEETLGTPIEVEPLDKTQLEDLGLNTYNHDLPCSSREVPSFDEPEPQPQPLTNCPSLNVSLGEEKGLELPIKPHSPDSFRIKVVDNMTIHTSPSPHMASFHPKDTYCYYHPCIDDPKK
uniref:Putative ribonuclease H-like domain-containing protein n=1 Tax=Tanacetum cinerariifolium TaxID=118510 RepID=A0A699GLG0_TANCI|nr:putative ribonuclease H-like domain-containing protein [Tanacetum cinerariifolium]